MHYLFSSRFPEISVSRYAVSIDLQLIALIRHHICSVLGVVAKSSENCYVEAVDYKEVGSNTSCEGGRNAANDQVRNHDGAVLEIDRFEVRI